jgi:transposase
VKRGRPGKDTAYKRIEHHHFELDISTDAEVVALDAASDGCFPFITNENCSATELLVVYKVQPRLERRHVTYKGVIHAAPVMLKSDTRIDALGFCLYVALLVHALVERQLRRAMAAKGIENLPLYYEDRPCTAPTATRVFELLDPLVTTTVLHDGEVLTVLAPVLDPLQRRLLTLLEVPHQAYQRVGGRSGKSC